jgi:GxxExxY protein
MDTNQNTNPHNLVFPELSYLIQGCVFEIRNEYGPGQKEIIYQRLFEEKLQLLSLPYEREKRISIYSQDTARVIGTYQPDFVVDEKIIIELKSSQFTTQLDEKQLYFYLRNSKYELGYLINFSTPEVYMKRIVYSNSKKPKISVD